MTDFTSGELKLMFQRIEEKLDDIKSNMSIQHARYDIEISGLRTDIRKLEETDEQLKEKVTKIATIGGTIWAIVTLLGGFILNRIF